MPNIPKWLTHDFLHGVFTKTSGGSNDALNWTSEFEPFAKKYENLASQFIRIKFASKINPKIEYRAFVKYLAEDTPNELGSPILTQRKMFQREGEIYQYVIPEMKKLLENIESEADLQFPEFYYYTVDPPILVFEDMTARGYDTYTDEYNVDDYKNILNKISIFHALSYYLVKEKKFDFSRKYPLNLHENGGLAKTFPFATLAYQMFTKVVATWENCEEFAEKLNNFAQYFTLSLEKCRTENPPGDGFNVLYHGDMHRNNFVFRNDRREIVPLDYQFTSWGSPACDLLSFFNAVLNIEDAINENLKNDLVKHYHTKFTTILQKLEFRQRIPTLVDVHVELLKHGISSLGVWCFLTPFLIMEDDKDDQKDSIAKYQEAYNSSRMQKLAKLFPDFLNKGYLDVTYRFSWIFEK